MVVRSGVVIAFVLAQPVAGQTGDIDKMVEKSRVLPSRSCPPPDDDTEIVVCGQRQDRFRIPEEYRGRGTPSERSWNSQALDLIEADRSDGQTVGASGASKFLQQMTRQWRAERAQIERERRALDRALDAQ
jgi:hypothetical protein